MSQTPATGSRVGARRRNWLPLLGLLALMAAAGGTGFYFLSLGRSVATVTVERGNVVRAFYATGVVRPDYEYVIKSRAQGALLDMSVREGNHVSQGQLMARVDDKQLRFEVEKTRAELREARAQAAEDAPQRLELLARLQEAKQQYEIAESQLKRVQSTYDKGVGTLTDVETAQRTSVQWHQNIAALEGQLGTWRIESQRRVDVAVANLAKAEANLADAQIVAPIDGVVLERYVEANQVVGINEKLFLVADPRDKLMKAAVDEEDIARTFAGQKVFMQLYAFSSSEPDEQLKPFEGRVKEILPTANPVNKTFEVKVEFCDPPAQLQVGMTAELNFIVDEPAADPETAGGSEQSPASRPQRRPSLVVPATAVMDGKVYRAVGGRYEPVAVVVGVRTLEKVEISSEELKPGDQVVADAKQVAPVKLPETKKPVVPTRAGDKEKVARP